MKKYKHRSTAFVVAALVISHLMCGVVAWQYRGHICGVQHQGFSAPADVAYFYAIPFLVAIVACLILAFVNHRKYKKSIAQPQNAAE